MRQGGAVLLAVLLGALPWMPATTHAETITETINLDDCRDILLTVQGAAVGVEVYDGDQPVCVYDDGLFTFAQEGGEGPYALTITGTCEAAADPKQAAMLRLPAGACDAFWLYAEDSDVVLQPLDAAQLITAARTRIALRHPAGYTQPIALDLSQSDCTVIIDTRATDYDLHIALERSTISTPATLPVYKGGGQYGYRDGQGGTPIEAQCRDSAIHVRLVLRAD